MSDNITKRVGLGTAYGFAKAGGYEGTVEQFTELLGNIAIDLARIENLSVTVTTLPAGSQATASLNGSVLSLGIPKGDKGDKGNTGETGAPAGFGTVSATVDANIGTPSVEVTASGADTAKNFAFAFHNLKGEKGDKGDTGEVSEAELTQAFEDFSENGTVANAEQLTTDIRANDQTPYLFRTAGGSVDIGDREYINGIVGGTVAFNQIVQNDALKWRLAQTQDGTISYDTTTRTATATATAAGQRVICDYDCPANHVMFVGFTAKSSVGGAVKWETSRGWKYFSKVVTAGVSTYASGIVKPTSETDSTRRTQVFLDGVSEYQLEIKDYQLIDLTQMFGSTIADYIYSLEQATAGAGVAFFKSLFPKPYYAYNAGELMSVKGLVSHDMVGFNAWDEEWEKGYLDASGNNAASNDIIRSKNYIPVVGGASYCLHITTTADRWLNLSQYDADKNFIRQQAHYTDSVVTLEPNTAFVRFYASSAYGITYNHDICINLSWDGSEDGNYEPYQKWSYPLDSDLELRGKFKLDANNNLYADGDVYPPSGQVQRKWKEPINLGALTWSMTTAGFFYSSEIVGIKAGSSSGGYNHIVSDKYVAENTASLNSLTDKCASVDTGRHIQIHDSAYSDAVSFKTALDGKYAIIELATPTTETADPYTSPQIVNDFGTEDFVISNTVAVPIPVGHNTDYPVNLKAKVEMMPNSPDGDGDYIVRQTNGTNEYVSIANNATIQNIISRLEALEG